MKLWPIFILIIRFEKVRVVQLADADGQTELETFVMTVQWWYTPSSWRLANNVDIYWQNFEFDNLISIFKNDVDPALFSTLCLLTISSSHSMQLAGIVGKNWRRRRILRTQAGRVMHWYVGLVLLNNHPSQSQHIRQLALMPLPLISSRLLRHHTTRSLYTRFVCKAELFCSRCQTRVFLIHSQRGDALQKTSPSLRQHPLGIPEEPGPQSLHLVVQILLQNHGYPFHPKDLEKGQGWKTW